MKKILKISFLAFMMISVLQVSAQKKGKRKVSEQISDTVSVNYNDAGMPSPDSLGFKGDLKASYYYIEGLKKYLIDKNNEDALQLFLKTIELDPDYAPAYYDATHAIRANDPKKALEYSETANRIDTANVWYKNQLARQLIINEKYSQALDVYEELIKLSPKEPEYYSMLASLYEYTRQPFSAIATLEKAEKTIGLVEELAKHKRELLVQVGLYDKAIEEGKLLTANYPYDYSGYLELAQLYAETKQDSLALDNYSKALELNPDGLDIIASMNEYYKIKGDNANYLATAKKLILSDELPLDIKIRMFRDIISNNNFYRENYFTIRDLAATFHLKYPDDYTVTSLYADNIQRWNGVEESVKIYKEFITDTTTDIRPFMDVLNMEAFLNRPDSVTKYSAAALQRFPENVTLYIMQGSALSYMGKEKEAFKAYENALKYSQSDSAKSVAYGIIGDEYQKNGDNKKSYNSYEKALRLWPDNVVVLNNYAYFLSEEDKDLDKALGMSAKVMELEPSNPTYMDTYGWVLFKLGRLEEAKKIIQQAVALDDRKSSELLLHYGDILYALGDNYMASVYWKRAEEAGYDPKKIAERLALIKQ